MLSGPKPCCSSCRSRCQYRCCPDRNDPSAAPDTIVLTLHLLKNNMKLLAIFLLTAAAAAQNPGQHGASDAPLAPSNKPTLSTDNWEHLPDGSLGRPDEF